MNLPIVAYGHKMLRQKCGYISQDYPNLQKLIDDLWETMENANGCGLAAPQIGKPVRLFVVNSKTTFDNLDESKRRFYYVEEDTGIIETFINAKIIESSQDLWADDEGCLSIPGLSREVERPWTITIEYFNRSFEKRISTFGGATARMVQHEYDHTEGILYIDYLPPLTRRLVEGKLKRIARGLVKAEYPMLADGKLASAD